MGPVGAGEGSAFVPEEFGFHQVCRQGAAAHRNEGVIPARGKVVAGAGHQFLAGAALAGDQDGGLAGGDLPHLVQQVGHGAGGMDQAAFLCLALQEVAQPGVVLFQFLHVEGLVHRHQEFVPGEGLQQVGERAQAHGLHRLFHRAVGRQHHHRRRPRAVVLAHAPEHLHAVDARHAHVRHDQVGRALQQGQTGFPVTGLQHLVPGFVQDEAHDLAQAVVVVDDEDPGHGYFFSVRLNLARRTLEVGDRWPWRIVSATSVQPARYHLLSMRTKFSAASPA